MIKFIANQKHIKKSTAIKDYSFNRSVQGLNFIIVAFNICVCNIKDVVI